MLIVAAGVWELLSVVGVGSNDLPGLDLVFGRIASLLGKASTWSNMGTTFAHLGICLGLAVITAVPLGVVLGRSDFAYRSSRVVIDFLRTVPGLALVPLAVFMFGTKLETVLVIVIPTCFWPLLLQTYYGARDVEALLFDVGRVYGLKHRQMFTHVVVPSCATYAATGLRLAATWGLAAVFGTELIAGTPGLGLSLAQAQQIGDNLSVYAYTLMIAIMGYGIAVLLMYVERRLIPWRAEI